MSPDAAPAAARWLRAVHWYLRELVGETEYERYLQHQQRAHPGAVAVTRREFERSRWEAKARTPGNRCC
jgi:uncharacterized short protein YbdD (DUF466 family)